MVNGIAVALGIGLIQLLVALFAGSAAAQLAVSGAVCASLADLPNSVSRTWHRVSASALLTMVAALTMGLLRPYPVALGFGVAGIAFCSMMVMTWGVRAAAVAFAPIVSMVFSMAVPATGHPLAVAAWSACGCVLYFGWSLVAAVLLQPRYRTLALAAAVREAARLFRSRASVLDAGSPRARNAAPMTAWIRSEAALADRLQSARDLLFVAPDNARSQRDAAILLRVIDLRDVLLASPLDVELLGADATSGTIRARVAQALRATGDQIEDAANALRDGTIPAADSLQRIDFDAGLTGLALAPDDPRARLVPALMARVRQVADDVSRIQCLLQGHAEPLPLTHEQLQLFISPEGWPLGALRPQWDLDSPVLRHAVRTSVALGSAYFLALALPWGSHPYWLVLSVAVVLRGNLGDTLARRNARVLGTILGCLVVVGLSGLKAPDLLRGIFLAALGAAHAFATQRYWLTATAASVMALLQSHLVNPGSGFAINERIADTILGALLAWIFSYVLPSWERRSARLAITRIFTDLQKYAAYTLRALPPDLVAERLARRRAYDSLQALGTALQRSHFEPRRVRLPVATISAMLDHGERLMAHLSIVRLLLTQIDGNPALLPPVAQLAEAYGTLCRQLDLAAPPPPAPEGEDLDAEGLQLLPQQLTPQDVSPWLARRLQQTLREGARLRGVADTARDAA